MTGSIACSATADATGRPYLPGSAPAPARLTMSAAVNRKRRNGP